MADPDPCGVSPDKSSALRFAVAMASRSSGSALNGGRGHIRGGVHRSRTMVRFLPEHDELLRQEAERMGLCLGDTVVALTVKALGLEVPDYIQEEMDAARAARDMPTFDFSERNIA